MQPSTTLSPTPLFQRLKASRIVRKRLLPAGILLATTAVTFWVIGQTTPPSPPNIPPVNLSADPLYAASGGDKPAIALALSVEFPTVGAQYTSGGDRDATYSNLNEYLGYYDAESCYTYIDAPSEAAAAGLTKTDYKRFDRIATPAKARKCDDAFSGNFLNWASNSAVDMLRVALSGGDRYIDEVGPSGGSALTILQRALIPNGEPAPACMWNSPNFPAKQLQRNGGANGTYWGAVPKAMITAAGTNDIWVANTLNRIYFRAGQSPQGTCNKNGAREDYALNTIAVVQSGEVGPVISASQSLPADATLCANEYGTCKFDGIKDVWYGANSSWRVRPAKDVITCSNDAFSGDPIGGAAKKCYYRNPATSWGSSPASNTTTGVLNTDGFFYARVQVCKSDAAGGLLDVRDYPFCKQYPNGKFKPAGSIQKYSDQLRLAAFGYLLDQTGSDAGGRYGGVLRVPMKYVGPQTYGNDGRDNTASGGNPNREWDPSTGVFYPNPDGDTTQTAKPISGIINYLNKFGRTGSSPGNYKIYDPVGELYYESLRYLQGLPPTDLAVSNITPEMSDGFPVAKTWADPYGNGRTNAQDYSCLKSNIVVIGDINSQKGLRWPTANVAANVPDYRAWTKTAENFENNISSIYIDGQGVSRTTGNPNPLNLTASYTDNMIGAAYWAHTQDIRGANWTEADKRRPGLRVKSYFFDVNEFGGSNDAATRRSRNQFFAAAKYGGFESDPSNFASAPYNTFGNPYKRQDGTNDNNVWQRPTDPGEASSYYLQSNARGVLKAFDSIFGNASTAARSIAGAASSNKKLTEAGSSIYQPAFDTSDWSGDVLSVSVRSSTPTATVTVGAVNNWSAAALLTALPTPATTRNIVVGLQTPTLIASATNFVWSAIDESLKSHLAKESPASVADTKGEQRLNYLRGDRTLETATFRKRNKLLGDIINSGIAYSGKPIADVGSSVGYSGFLSANASRTPTLFVGANDGMLHAFSATNGNELFGYIPSWMGPKLSALTSLGYNSAHQAYVDASPAVGEAKIGSGDKASDWASVLVSGTGAGGRGVFALNITDPTAFSASKVLWEFTQADDADMGFVIGKPQIVKMRTSDAGDKQATYRWFALVASGVNNYIPDANNRFSKTGNPAFFLLALDKSQGASWAEGTNYYKIVLPVDATLSAANATGLVNFRTTFAANREIAQIYAGDLHGKVWKLNFQSWGSTNWTISKLSGYYNNNKEAIPLYSAKTAAGLIQPITMAPSLKRGPEVGGLSTAYVFFATGKYLEVTDRSTAVENTAYTIFDNGTPSVDSTPALSAVGGRERLQVGTINKVSGLVVTKPFTYGRPTTNEDLTQRSGWYADLPYSSQGERQITSAQISGDTIIFSSLIPATTAAAGSCSVSGGGGNTYEVDLITGNGKAKPSTVGVLGEPITLESAAYEVSDTTGRRNKIITTTILQQGQGGIGAVPSQVTSTFVAGRLSWRQINNYLELKNAK
jgi:type IV pilus assembly protein PilY1